MYILVEIEKLTFELEFGIKNVDMKELEKYLKIVVSQEELERRDLSVHLPWRTVGGKIVHSLCIQTFLSWFSDPVIFRTSPTVCSYS